MQVCFGTGVSFLHPIHIKNINKDICVLVECTTRSHPETRHLTPNVQVLAAPLVLYDISVYSKVSVIVQRQLDEIL
jgi:hypothetical protein